VTIARFPVTGSLDNASGRQKGTVEIDRETGDFHVRPFRRKRTYHMPLSVVATMVCKAIILDELHQKQAAKKAKKAGRR